jgi:hypothetical protein
MGKKITNKRAEGVLLAFYLDADEDPKYDEFREGYNGCLLMVAHKHFGWTSGITASGYEIVQEAYEALAEFDYVDEIDDEDIDNAEGFFRS